MSHPRLPLFLLLLSSFFSEPLFAEVREWTNREGVVLKAEYLGHEDGKVSLKRAADGRRFEFDISSLSDADQDWLKSLQSDSGEGIYIAAGNGAHRLSSRDGITWTHHEFIDKPAHDQNDLKAIAVGNGVCVVVGGFSKSNIFTTADGVTWEKNSFNMGVLSGVIFVDGRFLAFGESARVAASSDGLEWEVIGDGKLRDHMNSEAEKLGVEPIKSNIRKWRHANGTFVGAGDNCLIVTTTDFENWTYVDRLQPQSRLHLETDGQGFVVRGDNTLHHSPDGLEWSEVTPEIPQGTRFHSLCHDGERYLVNSRGEEAWESTDGIEWSRLKNQTLPGTIATLSPDLYYSFEIYWKYTENLKLSRDGGKTWEDCTLPAPAGITCVTFAPGFPALSPNP